MNRKIIFKIIDERQYKLSHAYKDINLKQISKNTSKIILFDDNNSFQQKILSAGDKVEYDLNFNSNEWYIFPIFYNHAEQIDSLNIWRNEVYNFLLDNKDLLSKKNVVVCICDPYEASTHLAESVENILKKFNFKLLLISANKKLKVQHDLCNVIYNDTWIEKFKPKDQILPYQPKRLYINLNRVARYHRCALMDSLIENDLLKFGYNSWGNTYGAFENYKKNNPNTKIDKQKYDILDIKDLSKINPNYIIPEQHCINSFLFLTTETSVDPNQLFFSEKTYKPIGIGMPFITLGNPGLLEDLRNRGFITFNEWFDENYDNDLRLKTRIDIIIKNLEKYKKYKKNDLQIIRNEMNDILTHNLNLYKIIKRKNYLRENLLVYFQENNL